MAPLQLLSAFNHISHSAFTFLRFVERDRNDGHLGKTGTQFSKEVVWK